MAVLSGIPDPPFRPPSAARSRLAGMQIHEPALGPRTRCYPDAGMRAGGGQEGWGGFGWAQVMLLGDKSGLKRQKTRSGHRNHDHNHVLAPTAGLRY